MNLCLVKVCGNTEAEDIRAYFAFENHICPDFLGFIIYKNSKRYVSLERYKELHELVPKNVKTVLVCVNEDLDVLKKYYEIFHFSYIQLHGEEDLNYINSFKKKFPAVKIIKTVSVLNKEDLDFTADRNIDFYLFDTKSNVRGGSGLKFNWNLLDTYNLKAPFMLSGGISEDDLETLAEVFKKHQSCIGVDINSRFEISPGKKDVDRVSSFIFKIKELGV